MAKYRAYRSAIPSRWPRVVSAAVFRFKIRDYDALLNILSQRLAVKLLSEQRTLLVQVLQQEYISGHIDANFETD